MLFTIANKEIVFTDGDSKLTVNFRKYEILKDDILDVKIITFNFRGFNFRGFNFKMPAIG